MKQVLVIGSRTTGTKNDPLALTQALNESAAVTSRTVYWEDLVFRIATGNVDVLVDGASLFDTSYDVVLALGWYKNGKDSYYRDVAYSLALVLNHRGIAFWNSEMGTQRSMTKLSAMVQLALEGVPVPTTHFSIDFAKLAAATPLPFVAKAIAASRGENNFLVKESEDVQLAHAAGVPLLVQEYLENTHDLRIICFGGEPKLALRRSRADNADTHLNNTSQGGSAEWLDVTQLDGELLTFSRKISKITNREMAGIDFIPDEKSPFGYSCLEVNAIPQLTSGTDVATKLAALTKTIETLNQ